MRHSKIRTFMCSLTVLPLFPCWGGEQVSLANSVGWGDEHRFAMGPLLAWHLPDVLGAMLLPPSRQRSRPGIYKGRMKRSCWCNWMIRSRTRLNAMCWGSLGEKYFKLSKIHVVSKSTARAMAVITQYQKENLRKFYKGRKHKRLEQWPKMTHGWATRAKWAQRHSETKNRQQKEQNPIPYTEVH